MQAKIRQAVQKRKVPLRIPRPTGEADIALDDTYAVLALIEKRKPEYKGSKLAVALGFLLALMGVGLFLIVAFMVMDNIRILTTAQRVEGVITGVEITTSRDSDGDVSHGYYPVAMFQVEGQEYRVKSSNGVLSKSDYVRGQKVNVLYNPANLNEARIEVFSTMWLMVIVVLIFAVALSVMGVGVWRALGRPSSA